MSDRVGDLPGLTNLFALVMALVAVLGFAALWLYIIDRVWRNTAPTPPVFNEAVQYIAPSLTALIGGIVAMLFGVSLEKTSQHLFGATLTLLSFERTTWLYGAYIVIYLLLGVASAVTWICKADTIPALVKNFAMTTIGLIVAVVGASFGVSH
ncbi:hypothetical protein [Zoogloea sp.]|uniref:hypothetical protein n=1 Tax=Zoogloea sp. TaxID=49181 RepID=UPI0035B21876